jgi:hypothetical protein
VRCELCKRPSPRPVTPVSNNSPTENQKTKKQGMIAQRPSSEEGPGGEEIVLHKSGGAMEVGGAARRAHVVTQRPWETGMRKLQ